MLLIIAIGAAAFPQCPGASCPGTSWVREASAVSRVAALDLDALSSWSEARRSLVSACGLKIQSSTKHCFNDFNHVDCCAMEVSHAHRTNEESRVPGMHAVNALGAHIIDGSVKQAGPGGSWCTCQLAAPYDVCHRQFGAEVAFKLMWCEVERGALAAVVDEWGNLLNQRWFEEAVQVPTMGGPRARTQAWAVISRSSNSTMRLRWEDACAQARRITAQRATPSRTTPPRLEL